MIKELKGMITDINNGYITISCGAKEIKARTDLPFEIGMYIHFFCNDKTGEYFEPVFKTPKNAEEIRGYISLSGRIPGLFKKDADKLTGAELVSLAQSADTALPGVRKKLGDKKTDTLINYFKTQPMNDAAYLSLKRRCPYITWEAFAKCVGNPPRVTSMREITADPYAFFKNSGLTFNVTDKAAVALGSKGNSKARIDAFVNDLFLNKGLKDSTCCPEDVLIRCINRGLHISEAAAGKYVKEGVFNGDLIVESDVKDVYIYLPLQHRLEIMLAQQISRACTRKMSTPGIVGAINTCKKNGTFISNKDEAVLRGLAKSPVCTIISEKEDLNIKAKAVEACFSEMDLPFKIICPHNETYILKDAAEDEKRVSVVLRANEISYSEYLNIFQNLDKKEKLIFIGSGVDVPDVAGHVFLDIARSGICPCFGQAKISLISSKYSMLDTFLRREVKT